MALYKGNRDSEAKPMARRSALRQRDGAEAPSMAAGFDHAVAPAYPSPHADAGGADEIGEDEQPALATEIPMPHSQAVDPSPADGGGRVLGRARTAAQVPSHLEPYRESVIIGGDPRRETPPPQPQFQDHGQHAGSGMEQTMAAPMAPPPPAIDKEIIERAQMEAQQIVSQAQMHAQQLVADTQAQASEQIEAARNEAGQQGYQDGMQQGFQAGQEQGMAETVQRIEQLKSEFVELVLARRKVLLTMESEIVHLAVDVAEKIVGMELSTGREIITGIVRQAISTLKERDEVVIRVNPSEVDVIKGNKAEYETMIDGLKRLEVISDGAIEPGSCSIETNMGNVDARINTQFEAVRQGLDEMCKIRAFEMNEKLAKTPVEVPGDPEFHAKILEAEAEAKAAAARAAAGQH